ncbi:MAG TPA: FIST N-terminal domain-containing protein [Verrucomicrobiae bacterium]|nr:FIST N-terminal domain-containing protein [Verrucomicrobiae bacterium]
MNTEFSVAAHWGGDFDEAGLQKWAEQLRSDLRAPADLGLIFMSPRFFDRAKQILEIVRVHAQIPLLAGCSSQNLIFNGEEIEENAGLVLGIYSLPGAKLNAVHFVQEQVEEANGPGYWRLETGVEPEQTNGWLVFIDPFHLDSETWLRSWNEAYAPLPITGGLASGKFPEQRTQIYLNDEVFEAGGVAISIGGDVKLATVISQGCTPIGETWTLTRVEDNLIHEIGNRPAYEVLAETFNQLSAHEQKVARGNLFIGLVVNEYLEDFHRGDFLIRNLLGADPQTGSVAVGAFPRAGQTMQFQRRSASAAMEDMSELLARAGKKLEGATIYGGCLCSCNGRGQNLFGRPNHDAKSVQEQFGPVGVAGFFCNGEIGPVGEKSFLHGFTASLTLFVRDGKS